MGRRGRQQALGEAKPLVLTGSDGYTAIMAGPPSATFAQITWRFSGVALPRGAACTLGVTAPLGGLPALGSIAEGFAQAMEPWMVTEVHVADILIKFGPVATGPTEVYPSSANGTNATDISSRAQAWLIHKRVAGVSGRFAGRMYWPGVPESLVGGNGDASTVARLDIEGELLSFYTELGLAGSGPVVFSSQGGDPRPVERFDVDPLFGNQRRRNRR